MNGNTLKIQLGIGNMQEGRLGPASTHLSTHQNAQHKSIFDWRAGQWQKAKREKKLKPLTGLSPIKTDVENRNRKGLGLLIFTGLWTSAICFWTLYHEWF